MLTEIALEPRPDGKFPYQLIRYEPTTRLYEPILYGTEIYGEVVYNYALVEVNEIKEPFLSLEEITDKVMSSDECNLLFNVLSELSTTS